MSLPDGGHRQDQSRCQGKVQEGQGKGWRRRRRMFDVISYLFLSIMFSIHLYCYLSSSPLLLFINILSIHFPLYPSKSSLSLYTHFSSISPLLLFLSIHLSINVHFIFTSSIHTLIIYLSPSSFTLFSYQLTNILTSLSTHILIIYPPPPLLPRPRPPPLFLCTLLLLPGRYTD